jgi:hypothetical protein
MKTNSIPLKNLLAALALCLAAPLAHAEFAASTGFDYTTGKYGFDSATEISNWSLTGEYTAQDWTEKIILPFERVSSPGGVTVINGKPQLIGSTKLVDILKAQHLTLAQYRQLYPTKAQKIAFLNANAPRETNAGLGDVELATRYDAYKDKANGWDIGLNGAVTFGTADSSKGLGTGRATYDLNVDLSRTIGRFTPTAGFGYRIVCKPSDTDLRNYIYGMIGCSYWVTDDTNMSITFESDQRSSASSNVDNELSFGLNHHLAKTWDLEAHVLAGLSQAAPDLGLGASVRYTF